MKGPPPRVSAPHAIASIREYTQIGVRVLCVEGFTVVPEGFRADFDLMFTASAELALDEAASETKAFIEKHARPDVIWEVWADD